MVMVDLVGDELVPEQPRHGPEDRPCILAEPTRLDQGDAGPAPEVGRPVERVTRGHRSRSLSRYRQT